ncbi:hypothetical protein [Streptomyces uncialis]|uniref:hypothetical protein n=1 Tax=Streptomyces uncialis TaxID=1048205 RepID=UPI00386B0FF4|nr:hypothetical protein OG924_33010 [Streptomyces uncialis]
MRPAVDPVPAASQMRHYVAEFVERVNAPARLPLDYSVGSLRVVDLVVDGLRRGGAGGAGARPLEALFGFGAYAGEVLVRKAGAVWVELDRDQREVFGQPLGVRMPDGRLWNPLGKVLKRFDHGAEESVALLYLQIHGRRRRSDPAYLGGGEGSPRRAS